MTTPRNRATPQKAITVSDQVERQLEEKRILLAALEEDLVSSELELATLAARLQAFQRIYLEAIGQLIVELDELEAEIAEAIAKQKPKDKASSQAASGARSRATQSARAFGEQSKAAVPAVQFEPTEDLSKLFRAVAKRIHPDLASNDEDRENREELMKRANAAYQNGDAETLRSMLQEYEAHPGMIEAGAVSEQLARITRKINLVQQRLGQIRREIDQIMRSDLYALWKKAQDAKTETAEFLAEMAVDLKAKIQRARATLVNIQASDVP